MAATASVSLRQTFTTSTMYYICAHNFFYICAHSSVLYLCTQLIIFYIVCTCSSWPWSYKSVVCLHPAVDSIAVSVFVVILVQFIKYYQILANPNINWWWDVQACLCRCKIYLSQHFLISTLPDFWPLSYKYRSMRVALSLCNAWCRLQSRPLKKCEKQPDISYHITMIKDHIRWLSDPTPQIYPPYETLEPQ